MKKEYEKEKLIEMNDEINEKIIIGINNKWWKEDYKL